MAKAAFRNAVIRTARELGCLHETAPAGSGERAGEGCGQYGGGKTGGLEDPRQQRRGTAEHGRNLNRAPQPSAIKGDSASRTHGKL